VKALTNFETNRLETRTMLGRERRANFNQGGKSLQEPAAPSRKKQRGGPVLAKDGAKTELSLPNHHTKGERQIATGIVQSRKNVTRQRQNIENKNGGKRYILASRRKVCVPSFWLLLRPTGLGYLPRKWRREVVR